MKKNVLGSKRGNVNWRESRNQGQNRNGTEWLFTKRNSTTRHDATRHGTLDLFFISVIHLALKEEQEAEVCGILAQRHFPATIAPKLFQGRQRFVAAYGQNEEQDGGGRSSRSRGAELDKLRGTGWATEEHRSGAELAEDYGVTDLLWEGDDSDDEAAANGRGLEGETWRTIPLTAPVWDTEDERRDLALRLKAREEVDKLRQRTLRKFSRQRKKKWRRGKENAAATLSRNRKNKKKTMNVCLRRGVRDGAVHGPPSASLSTSGSLKRSKEMTRRLVEARQRVKRREEASHEKTLSASFQRMAKYKARQTVRNSDDPFLRNLQARKHRVDDSDDATPRVAALSSFIITLSSVTLTNSWLRILSPQMRILRTVARSARWTSRSR